ncbi:SAM-dependent chlorinase/fluorinase [Streptosporangium sp. NPDC049248]|uniref:SAM hydrolase/SAM-dependent halogenase family protein n=1 Tax=Streptosporangium sp. NPDC049248 TaxID=3155651 RepID=UPI00343CE446
MTSVISLLTDYGLEDGYIAACHGVIVGISPESRIIDVCHLVPLGDVRRGAAILAQTITYLPPGVHVAAVDPSGSRRAVAVEAGDHVFLGPDNGLLSWAIHASGGARAAYELSNEEFFLPPLSPTFHGRDLFAPVAAYLAIGRHPAEMGEEIPINRLISLPAPTSTVQDDYAEGEVLSVNRHGNIQLSIGAADLMTLRVSLGDTLVVWMGGRRLAVPFKESFTAVPPGEIVSFIDSVGLVALAINSGDASQRLGLPPGARVRLSPAP